MNSLREFIKKHGKQTKNGIEPAYELRSIDLDIDSSNELYRVLFDLYKDGEGYDDTISKILLNKEIYPSVIFKMDKKITVEYYSHFSFFDKQTAYELALELNIPEAVILQKKIELDNLLLGEGIDNSINYSAEVMDLWSQMYHLLSNYYSKLFIFIRSNS